MSITARPRATPAAPTRLVAATLARSTAGAACGATRTVDSLAPPFRPTGTIGVPADTDVPGTVERVHTTVTGAGGTVGTVVDHAADAAAIRVSTPPSTEVIGTGIPGRTR
jgi:hypothetical protein